MFVELNQLPTPLLTGQTGSVATTTQNALPTQKGLKTELEGWRCPSGSLFIDSNLGAQDEQTELAFQSHKQTNKICSVRRWQEKKKKDRQRTRARAQSRQENMMVQNSGAGRHGEGKGEGRNIYIEPLSKEQERENSLLARYFTESPPPPVLETK